MREKDFWGIAWSIFTITVVMSIFKLMGITGGFIQTATALFIIATFFRERLGPAGPRLLKFLGMITVVLFILSWNFTGPTARWAIHEGQKNAPRETFDPTVEAPKGSPTADAAAKFVREADGTLRKVPVEWKRDPRTGVPLAEPGTAAFWSLLNEYELQEAQRRMARDAVKPCEETELGWKVYRKRFISVNPGDEVRTFQIQDDPGGMYRKARTIVKAGCVALFLDGQYVGDECLGRELLVPWRGPNPPISIGIGPPHNGSGEVELFICEQT